MQTEENQAGPVEWHAIAELYRAFFTGFIMTVITRRNPSDAAELVFRFFRRQHQKYFLPGLVKLGLTDLPPAVAAAQYHYLSNWIGGVRVEYAYESDRKAWIRYPPPRWIWGGTAICAIPAEVSRAMLRGWHGHSGVSLRNPRLGFVCTKQTVDGQDGLEGFYQEYDRELAPDERLVFSRHLQAPLFDPSKAPVLPTVAWPAPRLAKAHRDYAMGYVRTVLPTAVALFGPEESEHLLYLTGRLIGMQCGAETVAALSPDTPNSAEAAAQLLRALFVAQGDDVSMPDSGGTEVAQLEWRLMSDVEDFHPVCHRALVGLVQGMLATCMRHASLTVDGDGLSPNGFTWRLE